MSQYNRTFDFYLNKKSLLESSYSSRLGWLNHNFTFMAGASTIPALMISMGGLRAEMFKFPDNIYYIIILVLYALVLLHSLSFLISSLRMNLFKKKWFALAIAFSPLIAILVSFLISFTAIKENLSTGTSYNVVIPVIFQLLIGLPSFIVYLIFCDYAFFHVTSVRTYYRSQEELEQAKAELKAEIEKAAFENVTYKYHSKKAEKNNK